MKTFKKIFNIILSLGLLFLLILFLATIFTGLNTSFGFNTFIVQSGSMEPSIKTGSLSIAQSQNSYNIGEVIAFSKTPQNSKQTETIMHRVVEKSSDNIDETYITKGDANTGNDQDSVAKNNIVGKIIINIPFLGYAVSFTKTIPGFIILIVFPASIIILMEAISLKNEAFNILKNKSKNKKNTGKIKFAKYFTIFLVSYYLLSLISLKSSAIYSDEEKAGAIIQTAINFKNEDKTESSDCTSQPEVLFYLNEMNNGVGFVLNNVGAYDFFEYEVIYDHTTEFGKLTEKIEGEIPNPNYKGTVLEEDIFMGTETTGGMRVNHTGIGEIKLNVFLENSGFIEKTLSKTLNI